MPNAEKLQAMIEKAQNQIQKMQDQLASGNLTPEEQAEALETIEDMLQKIERLAAKQ